MSTPDSADHFTVVVAGNVTTALPSGHSIRIPGQRNFEVHGSRLANGEWAIEVESPVIKMFVDPEDAREALESLPDGTTTLGTTWLER